MEMADLHHLTVDGPHAVMGPQLHALHEIEEVWIHRKLADVPRTRWTVLEIPALTVQEAHRLIVRYHHAMEVIEEVLPNDLVVLHGPHDIKDLAQGLSKKSSVSTVVGWKESRICSRVVHFRLSIS